MSQSRSISLDREEIDTIRLALAAEVERQTRHYLGSESATFMNFLDRLKVLQNTLEKLR